MQKYKQIDMEQFERMYLGWNVKPVSAVTGETG
jgi:hypothetical protein